MVYNYFIPTYHWVSTSFLTMIVTQECFGVDIDIEEILIDIAINEQIDMDITINEEIDLNIEVE